LQVLQTTISLKMEHIKFELHIKLFNASHVSLVYEKQFHRNVKISSRCRLNYTKMLIKNTSFRAFIEAKSSMISSKSAFSVSSLCILIKARSHNLS